MKERQQNSTAHPMPFLMLSSTDSKTGASGLMPPIGISGGGGSGASCRAVTNGAGVVTSIVVDNGGSGYTSTPTASTLGGSGTGFTLGAVAVSGGVVTAVAVSSGGTGYGPTVTIAKDAGLFASCAGTVIEQGNGWYALQGNATDRNTLGHFGLHASVSGADPCDENFAIVGFDPFDSVRMGMTSLPSAAAGTQPGGLVRWGDTLPSNPTANTVDEAWYLADTAGGRRNMAQGGTSTTITLDSGASSDSTAYVGDGVYLYGGTGGGLPGTGQLRTIVAYNGSTKVAIVNRAWGTTPDNTSKFITLPLPKADVWMIFGSELSSAKVPATLASTDVTGNLPADVQTIKTQAVTAASGITFPGTIGTSTYAGADTSGTTTLLARLGQSVLFDGSGNVKSNAQTVADKTGYALTSGEHVSIQSDVASGLTTQGYTTTRAGYLDTLNGLVAATWNALTSAMTTSGSVGKKLATWALGSDNRVLLSTDAQTGVTIPTVTTVTNSGSDSPGVTTLLTRIPGVVQPQTGDSYSRLGSPAHGTIAADVADVSAGGGATAAEVWSYSTRTITSDTPNVSVVSPVLNSGSVVLVRGDDYKAADGRALVFTSTGWPDLTGATVRFSAFDAASQRTDISSKTGSVLAPTGTAQVQVELLSADTLNLTAYADYLFDVRATLADGDSVTLTSGKLCAEQSYTSP